MTSLDWLFFFIGIFWAALIIYKNFLLNKNQEQIKKFTFFFFLKLSAAIFYTSYYYKKKEYISDFDTHFTDMYQLSEILFKNPWLFINYFFGLEKPDPNLVWTANYDPRSFHFLRISFPLFLISGRNPYILSSYFCLLSTWALFRFYETIKKSFSNYLSGFFVGFLYLPGMLFWASGFSKETLAYISIFGLITALDIEKFTFKNIIVIILLFLVFILIKPFYVALIIPFLINKIPLRYLQKHKLTLILLITGLLISLSLIFHKIWLYAVISYQINFSSYIDGSLDQKLITVYDHLTFDPLTMLPNLWRAFYSGFMRPLLKECFSFLCTVEAFQNLIFLSILLWGICKLFFLDKKINIFQISMIIISFTLGILTAFSFSSIGTLSRFRIFYIPWLIWIFASDLNSNKFLCIKHLKFKV